MGIGEPCFDGSDKEFLSVAKIEPRVPFYISNPCFIEGEGETIVYKIVH